MSTGKIGTGSKETDQMLGKRIRTVREQLKLSRKEFVERCGYSNNHLERIERGVIIPRPELLDRMCELYGINREWLMDENMQSEHPMFEPGKGIYIQGEEVSSRRRNADSQDESTYGREEVIYQGIKGKETAGERVKSLRLEKGMMQKDFAKEVGISVTNLLLIETGQRELSRRMATKIESRFAVGADWLIYGRESARNYPLTMELLDFLEGNECAREVLWDMFRKSACEERTITENHLASKSLPDNE